MNSKNDFIIINNNNDICVEIILKNIENKEVARTLIDYDDLELISNEKWRLNCCGYAINSKNIRLHKILMGGDELIDHIDRNPLNNRRNNLRFVTPSQNSINRGISVVNTSGFIGVIWRGRRSAWEARVKINRKIIYLGQFKNKHDAIVARLKGELKYFGVEFAPQRHLFEEYNIF